MVNRITWETVESQPFLDVDVKLNISLEVIIPLFPKYFMLILHAKSPLANLGKFLRNKRLPVLHLRISPGQHHCMLVHV